IPRPRFPVQRDRPGLGAPDSHTTHKAAPHWGSFKHKGLACFLLVVTPDSPTGHAW
ncbi:lymphocyte antigen 6K isoform 2 precursor, partial [Daubentonia madagascariensis]